LIQHKSLSCGLTFAHANRRAIPGYGSYHPDKRLAVAFGETYFPIGKILLVSWGLSMRISSLNLGLLGFLVLAAPAEAQQRTTAQALMSKVADLLGHTLRLDKLGCFVTDTDTLKCTTYTGVYIVPRDVVPASLKAKIRASCGGIIEFEDEPFCLFDGVFTPSSMERGRGQVTDGDRSVDGDILILYSPPIALTLHR
jgi:hypothetical protein